MRARFQQARAQILAALKANLTPRGIGLGVGIGVFIGLLPLHGIHFFICIFVARALGLNMALMYSAANISNPLIAPAIIAAQILLGSWVRTGTATPGSLPEGTLADWMSTGGDVLLSLLIGGVISAAVAGPLFGFIALLAARRWAARS